MKESTEKVFIKNFGCQMNVRDSEVIAGLLTTNGLRLTTKLDDADIVILNTCSVRQHAEDKAWSEIGRISKRYPLNVIRSKKPVIGIVGCMAQNYKEEIFRRLPQVDFVVGPSDIAKIPGIIKSLAAKGGDSPLLQAKIWETGGGSRPDEVYHTGFYIDKTHAYVVISEGCSNFCSYCVVPYVRGQLRHRRHKDILREIKEAVDNGVTKLTLLGQNANAYEDNGVNFVRLVKSVNSVRGLQEFSFITSHPKDTGIELFKAMADCSKLRKYLHLPLQSGSDRILKLMQRGYTRKFYLELAQDYRKIVPGGALTTDIIVGFPTESEEDFQDTLAAARDIRFNAAYIFKYSPRPHTAAANLPDDVPRLEKEKRHGAILTLQKAVSRGKGG
jgi:tRNA-2-methylthio-N6-dimethylallyladenosine synthase